MVLAMTHFIKRIPDGDTKLRDVCNRCGFVNYENPRVVVGTVAVSDADKVQLAERDGEWTLPYDFMQVGETSKQGAARLIENGPLDVDHLLTFDEIPESGLVIMTFRGRLNSSTGALFPLDEAKKKLSANPMALHALELYQQTKSQKRFSPGFLRHSFSAAANPLDVMHVPSAANNAPVKGCGDCSFDKGGNVKLVSGVVATLGDKILLGKRAIPPRIGFWTLASGFMELGETLREGAAREADEETGAKVDIGELLAIYEIPKFGQVMTIFRGTLMSPDIAAGPESQDVGLFDWNDVPWNELAFPMVKDIINKHERYKHSEKVNPCHMMLTPIMPNKPLEPGVKL